MHDSLLIWISELGHEGQFIDRRGLDLDFELVPVTDSDLHRPSDSLDVSDLVELASFLLFVSTVTINGNAASQAHLDTCALHLSLLHIDEELDAYCVATVVKDAVSRDVDAGS